MKKLLLVFMSMFLVLGTSMAQKDENTDGSVEFGIGFMSPEDGAKVTSVSNIYLSFTKDVTAVLPEGGIDIINNDTKEVAVKIDSILKNEWADPKSVNFMFEQKMMPGEDGKEPELKSVILETPGTYSYTIPAGCIKSADNNAFPETTFTFTIVSTFPVVDYSPKETSKLDKIEVFFNSEVTEVKMPNNGLYVVDYYSWMPVANVTNTVISDDKKTVTLELDNAISAEGLYVLYLDQGVFVGKDGISLSCNLGFNVIDPTSRFVTNYQDGDQVEALGNLEITFKNVKKVEPIEGADPVTVYIPGEDEATGKAAFEEDNKITVTFEQEFTEEGEYLFVIPAGMFTMDGVPNEERHIEVNLVKVTITPLKVDSVTPVLSEEGAIVAIRVAFNQQIALAWDPETYQTISTNINLMDANGNAINLLEYYNPSLPYSTLEYVLGAYDESYNVVTTPITEAGTYTLDLSQIVVQYAYDPATYMYKATGYCEGIETIVYEGTSAIETVNAVAGEQAIYDLLGRRIEKITGAGIYIVNGKKVVIK